MSPTTEPRDTVRAIWQTRPSRRQSDRKLAGVAGAIARRYDIDPVLVRIGFVVAAIYGIGIVLYLAAWVTLPADRNDPPTGPLKNRNDGTSVHPLVVIAAVIAACGAAASLLHGDPGVLVGLAVVGGLLYLLHQSRAERGLAGGPTVAPTTAAPDGVATTAETAETAGTATTTDTADPAASAGTDAITSVDPPRQPPAWDPLGAAPFAWDLPEPAQQPPSPPPGRRRSILTPVTVAVALLAGGVTGAISIVADGLGGVRLVIGVMLAVVGLGLITGAFLRKGRGLILLALPLMLLAYGSTKAQLSHWQQSGDLRLAPTSVSQLAANYNRGFGTVELDLRRLDLSLPSAVPTPPPVPAAPPVPAPPPAPVPLVPVQTRVSLQAGDVIVHLPPDADVTVHCHADVGTVQCLGQHNDGGPSADVRASDLGLDGKPGGRPLDLEITVGAGTVSVDRG